MRSPPKKPVTTCPTPTAKVTFRADLNREASLLHITVLVKPGTVRGVTYHPQRARQSRAWPTEPANRSSVPYSREPEFSHSVRRLRRSLPPQPAKNGGKRSTKPQSDRNLWCGNLESVQLQRSGGPDGIRKQVPPGGITEYPNDCIEIGP